MHRWPAIRRWEAGQQLTEYVIMFGTVAAVVAAFQLPITNGVKDALLGVGGRVLGTNPPDEPGKSASTASGQTWEMGLRNHITTSFESGSSGSSKASQYILSKAYPFYLGEFLFTEEDPATLSGSVLSGVIPPEGENFWYYYDAEDGGWNVYEMEKKDGKLALKRKVPNSLAYILDGVMLDSKTGTWRAKLRHIETGHVVYAEGTIAGLTGKDRLTAFLNDQIAYLGAVQDALTKHPELASDPAVEKAMKALERIHRALGGQPLAALSETELARLAVSLERDMRVVDFAVKQTNLKVLMGPDAPAPATNYRAWRKAQSQTLGELIDLDGDGLPDYYLKPGHSDADGRFPPVASTGQKIFWETVAPPSASQAADWEASFASHPSLNLPKATGDLVTGWELEAMNKHPKDFGDLGPPYWVRYDARAVPFGAGATSGFQGFVTPGTTRPLSPPGTSPKPQQIPGNVPGTQPGQPGT